MGSNPTLSVMKAIICGLCNDIRALRAGEVVTCACGNVSGRWVDPMKGTAKIFARDRSMVRILGFDNRMLLYSFDANMPHAHYDYREMHKLLTESAQGFIFHTDMRNCPFAIFEVGQTTDVSWDTESPVKPA